MNQNHIITSPYNFVPMAEQVFYPEWQNISLDYPIENGLSGEISYQIKTHSPVLVGDKTIEDPQGTVIEFFKTPLGQYAIPGTSIKGMIRSWVEIASHSRMSIINDDWLSFRDLKSSEYRNLLTEPLGNQVYKTRTQAGWLKFEGGKWVLYPAQSWRVENSDIENTFKIQVRGKESPEIYKKLKGIQGVDFQSTGEKSHSHSAGNSLVYDKAENIRRAETNPKGYLIVTGQIPGPKNPRPGQSKGKHMNFIFSAPKQEPLEMASDTVMKCFLDINLDREDFIYLRNLNHRNGMPVFFIQEQGKVKYIGLAQMFRFPYEYSVGQLRHESHMEEGTKKDFAELLFGALDNQQSRKGRVSFSLAKCISSDVVPVNLKSTVLGAPRNSFYPAYIDQKNAKGKYHTYNQKEAKLAGFKRYAIHKQFDEKNLQNPPKNKQGQINYKVATQLRPLPSNTGFKGKVRFQNLNAVELGALLYALNLTANDSEHYFNIGLGKPLGLGKIKFEDVQLSLLDETQTTELSEYICCFADYANKVIGSDSKIMQLKMMQSEKTFSPKELKYKEFPKGFVDVLKTKGEDKLINLSEQAEKILASHQAQEQERKRKEKIQLENQKKLAELNKKSNAQELIQELGGELSGKALVALQDNKARWQSFSEEEQRELGHKICQGQFFKQKKTKGIRTKYPELLCLIELVNK